MMGAIDDGLRSGEWGLRASVRDGLDMCSSERDRAHNWPENSSTVRVHLCRIAYTIFGAQNGIYQGRNAQCTMTKCHTEQVVLVFCGGSVERTRRSVVPHEMTDDLSTSQTAIHMYVFVTEE